jgi:hypothetical protein
MVYSRNGASWASAYASAFVAQLLFLGFILVNRFVDTRAGIRGSIIASLLVLVAARTTAPGFAYCTILGLATVQAIYPTLAAPLVATYGAVGIHAVWGVVTTRGI